MITASALPSRRLLHLALWAVLLLASARVGAQSLFSGVWSQSNEPRSAWLTSDWDNFAWYWGEAEKDGLRLDDFEVYFEGSTPVYVGLFRPATTAYGAWITSDWNDFATQSSNFAEADMWLHDFETYVIDGVRWYAGIFLGGPGGNMVAVHSDWNQFASLWGSYESAGWRMHDFETYVDGGVRMYMGIFWPGTEGYGAWITQDWKSFTDQWSAFEKSGFRMADFEMWEDGGQWTYAGFFLPGSGGSYSWFGADWENFRSFWHEREKEGYILEDIEITPGPCQDSCMNLLTLPKDDYWYGITRTFWHCEGEPGTCPVGGDPVWYRAPIYMEGGERFVRLSAVYGIDPIFTLPFTVSGMKHNGWLYGTKPGEEKSWHHAIDYANGTSFEVRAAAPGTVLFAAWDNWSGNTVVVSHDVGADTDRYRTIYMHLRNGAANDCKLSWVNSAPPLASLANDPDPKVRAMYPNYTSYLEGSGCNSNGSGTPDATHWGTQYSGLWVKPGDSVVRGQMLGWSGATGPGGCGCTGGGTSPNTHLHIFFARRDPTDDLWYFFDPYGIYGTPDCYPTRNNADGASSATACTRYPTAWLDGYPHLPVAPETVAYFKRGDGNDDGKLDISDAINLLGCKFLGAACPQCEDAADANGDGALDLSDAILTLTCLFQRHCIELSDPSCQGERSRLGCVEYDACDEPDVPR